MDSVPLWRLYTLRAAYLLLVVGLGLTVWPTLLQHSPTWPLMNSVVVAMLCSLSALSVLGLRYPLQMIPLLLFEILWKALWLGFVALPLALEDRIDARTATTVGECLVVVLFLFLIPWRYVFDRYIGRRGDRWAPAKTAEAV